MKKSLFILGLTIAFFLFSSVSCEEPQGYTQIKLVETQIYNSIKSHREANQLSGAFVHQPLMVKECQIFSAQLAYSGSLEDTAQIAVQWDNLSGLGGYNTANLFQINASTASAESIVDYWKNDSASNSIILQDYTQCGVGVAYDTTNQVFVTVMLMKVDS